MNPAHVNDLMILVERSVRPVHASTAKKQKMREELLAHVTSVFEEELANQGSDRLALETTRRRFGEPAELTRRLQESVSPLDRYTASVGTFFIGAGVPATRLALRYAALAMLPAIFMLWAFYVQGRLAEWPLISAGVVLSFGGVLLLRCLRNVLFTASRRSWGSAALLLLAAWLLVPGVTLAICLLMSGDWRASLANVPPLLVPALLTPAVLSWAAYLITLASRSAAQWEALRIE
jgi:hypothetical protein